MKRFGYLIKLGGDPEIRQALKSGVDKSMKLVPAASSSEAVRRVAMYQHSPAEWAEMTRDARRDYGDNRPITGARGALLVGYAMICYAVSWAYEQAGRLVGR